MELSGQLHFPVSLYVKEPFWKPVDYRICFKDLAKTNVSIARN
jgi:hypothetical protein